MLNELLRLAAERGTASHEELARALDTSPELVSVMLEELVRRGRLRDVVPDCAKPCERCPLHAACLYRRQPRFWMLAHKGAV